MHQLRDIRRRFDRAAAGFDDVDFVHAVTRDGLVERLEPVVVSAATVLDLGSATGAAGRQVAKRFRRAHVVSLDLSHAMLEEARRNRRWLSRSSFVQADACRLPFADASFDLVIANQLLPWVGDLQGLFAEVARILADGGVFAFATLGPDSLAEIDAAWAQAEAGATASASGGGPGGSPAGLHVTRFADMHDIGDALVRAGLADPVLDVDRLAVRYDDAGKLFADLTATGGRNTLAGRSRGLAGKTRFKAMTEALYRDDGIRLELELVYGHCWGRGHKNDSGEFRVNAGDIPRRRQSP